jgi:hypothetical protein
MFWKEFIYWKCTHRRKKTHTNCLVIDTAFQVDGILQQYITHIIHCTSQITLSSNLVRWFSWLVDPRRPSVSKQITLKWGSNAAHTPRVQASCSDDVWNTSSPLKNVWFRVWDFPSPVLPNTDTTFTRVEVSQFNRFTNCSSDETYKR